MQDQTISFQASYGAGQSGILQQIGAMRATIVKTGDAAPLGTFTSFGRPSMPKFATFGLPSNQENLTGFRGQYGSGAGIFMGNGGALTTLVKTGDAAPSGTFTDFGNPSMSAVSSPMGTAVPAAAFSASYAGTSSIFLAANGMVTHVDSTPPAISYGDPYILNGSLAVRLNPGIPGLEAIYGPSFGGGTTIATVGQTAPVGTFTSFGDPIVTFLGVGFEATYGAGQTGIFGTHPYGFPNQPQAIIKTGDPLFGANVVSVQLSQAGGKSSSWGLDAVGIGDFAFHYVLSDGRQGIALVLATPEPATSALAILPVMAALRARRRNCL